MVHQLPLNNKNRNLQCAQNLKTHMITLEGFHEEVTPV